MIQRLGRRTVLKAMGAGAALGIVGSGSAELDGSGAGEEDIYGSNATDSFSVTIGDTSVSDIESVTVPKSTTAEADYREEETTSTLIGQTTYGDLTMERDMSSDDTTMWDWRQAAVEGRMSDALRTVTVVLQDSQGQQAVEWEFTQAWVKEYGPLELDSSAYADAATESITVAYDDMTRTQL